MQHGLQLKCLDQSPSFSSLWSSCFIEKIFCFQGLFSQFQWVCRLQQKKANRQKDQEKEERRRIKGQKGGKKQKREKGVERENLAYFKQERSRRRSKEPGENCLSSSPPSLFQLWISVAILPSSHPLSPPSSNRVYPSGFFTPISSPPAVLEEPFTAASAESVTLASLALAVSHTHFLTSFSLTHTSADSPQSSSFFLRHFLLSHSPLPISFFTLNSLRSFPHHFFLLLFSVARHSFAYLKMFHISLSVLRTSRYLSVYPSLTSIYSFNPSWPEDISPPIALLLSLPCFLTLLPSWFPPLSS